MPTFTITTLGCKVNQYESEAIACQLEQCHWRAAGCDEPSDLCIINTCTVTANAGMQSRQAVRRAIRTNPRARIVVTGCYAQTAAHALSKMEGVHYVIGHASKHDIGRMALARPEACCPRPILIGADVRHEQHFKQFPPAVYGNRTRPFLKIQDGCSATCTYCIVPFARGPSRSMPMNSVLQHIHCIADAGYHEVVLTGIHLGNYGPDLTPKTSLYELLRRIDEMALVDRVRLSSIEPLELTPDIIACVAESRRFCRHFHIPLQSGDDEILRNMNRPYTARYFRDLVCTITKQLPDAAVGVDVMVGFPGETDQAFENTCEIITALPLAYLHVFPFSPRPGTPANARADKIPAAVIKKRCEHLRKLGAHKRLGFYERFIGCTLEVLVEKNRDGATGYVKGVSSNYIPVLMEVADDKKNTIVPAKIITLNHQKWPLATIQCGGEPTLADTNRPASTVSHGLKAIKKAQR